LELLKTVPDTDERCAQEPALQTTIGPAWMAVKGYAAPEVERAYTLARELCQQIGDTSQLFTALRGLWVFYVVRAELLTARELGEELLQLAQTAQDPILLMEALYTLGATSYYLGEFSSAQSHVEQAIALYDPQRHRSHVFPYGLDSEVRSGFHRGSRAYGCLSLAAYLLWMFGYPQQAVKRSQEALILAQEHFHSHTVAAVLVYACSLHQLCRDGQRTKELAEAAVTLATEQGLPLWLAAGESCHGWALAEQGQEYEEIELIRQGLAAYTATGAGVQSRIHSLAALSEVYEKVGQTEKGLDALAEALALVDRNEERWLEAELYRLKGALTLQRHTSGPRSLVEEEAEAYFRKAMEIAKRQAAKSLELRAVMNLSRLWDQQGKKAEARQMLAHIYNWFSEGFDTKDLREAKALLMELRTEDK
jgi:predicted ATPase